MTRITGPLFGTCATGPIGDIGSFRQTPTGTSFVKGPPIARPATPEQRRIQECLAAAMRSWESIHEYTRPYWPSYWEQWQIDNPACRGTTPPKPPKTSVC